MEKQIYELRIDPEFSSMMSKLSDTEKTLLEQDLLTNGCISPLVTWNGILLDGHNRYDICKKHGIAFSISSLNLRDRDEAYLWIIHNQVARRNMTGTQRILLVLQAEERLKADGRKRMSMGASGEGVQKSAQLKTRDIMASLAGVSHATIDELKFVLKHGDQETIDNVENGKLKVHAAYKLVREQMGLQKQCKHKKEADINDGTEMIASKDHTKSKAENSSKSEHDLETVPIPNGTGSECSDELPPSVYDDLPYKPLTYLEKAMVLPEHREIPRTPYPFPYVKEQVWASIEELSHGVDLAMHWLREEDHDKIDILIGMINEGCKLVTQKMKEDCK